MNVHDFVTVLREQLPQTAGVAAVAATPCGTGQLADSFRLDLQYRNGAAGPPSVFVKLPPSDTASARTAQRINAFERESYFYTDLLPRLEITTPRLLGLADFGDAGVGVVLEDLTAVTRPLNQLRDGTPAQAASVMDQLAGLQAPFWDDVDAAGGDGRFYNRTQDHIEGLAERYLQSWHRHGETVGAGLDAAQRHLVDRFGRRSREWAAGIVGPRTLVHQDLRLDNLLWSDAGGAVLIDWQTLAFTSPAWDPAFLLGTALPAELRRQEERTLIARHADALAARGITGWDREQAWTEHRRLSGSVLLAMIAAMAFVAPTERGFAMFASLIERGTRQALDLNLLEFLD
ncbi:ecdysteroid 22-kinase family protein [Rhodococcus pyridinivorans]|uniref:Phosphotransferase n=1 Tax=Rhodococcus pyridinivorans TaxID=103816 RepID=A0A7M2XLS9_9NOCA|nr:phosphotransferase [Rhodococcus pyridinivorans]QOV98637.1 phosphotransferase [Rhodococcus pyridinivorans]UPW02398.1 ecdysteroid 22-kinase family protein [Rhodococcus pyridinivorans]WMM72531.1 phosphotransferase [Rhodococcus pyridinivorans]